MRTAFACSVIIAAALSVISYRSGNLPKLQSPLYQEISSAQATSTQDVSRQVVDQTTSQAATSSVASSTVVLPSRIKAPEIVRGVYMSSWVASTPSARNHLVELLDETELNSVVIDVKDNNGAVTWIDRMREDSLKTFIDELHAKDIYVIGRIAVFQDPVFAKKHTEEAVKRTDGSLWLSKKGEAWVDTGSQQMWAYIEELGLHAYALGFDEINLDYIRYPTDAFGEGFVFPKSGDRAKVDREGVVTEFYEHITGVFRKKGIPISGDVFGIITTSSKDIPVLGQNFAAALTTFDYVAPMVYPSHYAPGSFGLVNPAAYPKEVILAALGGAVRIADVLASSTMQSTSSLRAKIRPWYQDFDMGAVYTAELVGAQIEAGEGLGIKSYMMWDPKNTYTKAVYKKD